MSCKLLAGCLKEGHPKIERPTERPIATVYHGSAPYGTMDHWPIHSPRYSDPRRQGPWNQGVREPWNESAREPRGLKDSGGARDLPSGYLT